MSFLGEIKRRKIFQVAVVYAVVAWLLVQIVTAIEAPLNLPEWVDTLVIVLLALGFPITLIMSWAFNLTSDGLVREMGESAPTTEGGPRIDYVLIGVLAAAVAFLFIDNYLFDSNETGASLSATESSARPESSLSRAAPAPAAEVDESPARRVMPKSVAVLPFANLSPDAENAYFAAGIHEEVLDRLAKLRNLSVISRTSMLRYTNTDLSIPEIAAQLNVEAVMEGSVRYAGNRVRVAAQLIEASTDRHLWSEVYERELDDIFAIQADIAMKIANALDAEYSEGERAQIEKELTSSPEAYALFLRASRAENRQGARELLLQATEIDPQFAEAFGAIALLDANAAVNTDGAFSADAAAETAEVLRSSREYAQRAIAIDPNVRLAHTALAMPDLFSWRWSQAEQAFTRALAASPNDRAAIQYYGYLLNYLGRHDEAIALAERARELNPGNDFAGGYPFQLGYAGQFARAREIMDRNLSPDPGAYTQRNWVAMLSIAVGDPERALEVLRLSEALLGDRRPLVGLPEMAYAYGLAGGSDAAARILAELNELAEGGADPGAGGWAQAYLGIDDQDAALEWLEVAAGKAAADEPDAGFFNLMNLKMNVANDPRLRQAEFVAVLSRIRGD